MRVLALGLLAAAAVADASIVRVATPAASANCPTFCSREYIPVCGSDGVKYGNECLFQVAQCVNPSLSLVDCA